MLKNTVVILVILLLSITAFAERSKVFIPPMVDGKIVTHTTDVKPKPEALRSMVSRKNLLGLDRETPFALPRSKDGHPISLSTQEDTLNVLILKIEFQTEVPDDPTTTGNGNLDLRTYEEFVAEEGHEFDPAPHNTSYFSAHMRALNRYWFNVSNRQLRLNWDIYPQAENATFRLPHQMSYYGSEGPWPDSSIVFLLGMFFKDAFRLADTLAPEIIFSQYDSYIIFHAGSDQQNNLYFVEDTPNDFYTGFLWTADTTIKVDSGTFEIHEGLIMPETACQDNRVTVLNAVLAHEFGHQLGLIDLYNTSNFLTTIGDFSLMDNNGMSVVVELGDPATLVSGILPVFPDAWSRAYLGFSGVTEVVDIDDIEIPAAEQLYHDNEVIKVPISDYEYFLIENRRYHADYRYQDCFLSIDGDLETGVILGPIYACYSGDIIYKFESFDYDAFLPGDGLLIWHVDETVAYLDYANSGLNNFIWNTLQWDPNRRFVSLVEADGIVDFGGNYVAWGYYGIDADFFKSGNNTDLTPSTRPDSRSNSGADTHISITGISSSDTLMTCDIDVSWRAEGFPVMSFPDMGYGDGGLLAMDIDSDSNLELIAARNKFLMAVNNDGSPVIDADTSFNLIMPNFDGDTLWYHIPFMAMLDTMVNSRVVAGDFDGDDSLEIACFDVTGKLYFYEGYDLSPVDSLADLMDSILLPDSVTAGPVAYDFDKEEPITDDEIIAGFDDSVIRSIKYLDTGIIVTELDTLNGIPIELAISDTKIFIVYNDSEELYLFEGSQNNYSISELYTVILPAGDLNGLTCGDINRDDIDDAVLTVGNYLCIYDGESHQLKTIEIDNPCSPSLGDINSDGYPDIVLIGGKTFLTAFAYNYKGVLFDGFPARITAIDSILNTINQPLIADADNDGNPDIIISYSINKPLVLDIDNDGNIDLYSALSVGGVSCINNHGDMLGGFPLTTSSGITVEPIINDLDGDGDLEIAVIDSGGFFTAWDLDAGYNAIDQPWPTVGGDISGRGYLSPGFLKPVSPLDGFLPENLVYNYPNPASDRTTFRYYVDRPSNINIRIYDMSGEMIDELTDFTQGGSVPDEIEWDCSRFASGVYFARIEAEATNQNMDKNIVIKVALIK